MENKRSEPKNILEKVTTQLLSLFSIAFFAIRPSIAQRTVAAKIKKSPVLISAEIFVSSITKSPRSMMAVAKSCRFVIFSFRNMKAKMIA